MLKIVRGYNPYYSAGEPVKIDNTVYIPSDEEDEEFQSQEDMRRKAEEEKAEEERRFSEAVEASVSKILEERAFALEQERSDIIERARREASAITSDAKAAMMAVMEKAQKECEQLKEQAKQEGHDEGFEDGRKESLDKYKKYIDAAGRLLSEINSRKEAYYISNEEEMRDTLFDMVKKITRSELKSDPKIIDGIIAEAAKNFRNSDFIKITLSEDSLTERFKTDENLIKEIIPFIPEIEIEFDEEAEEGAVIEDNGSEIVDAGVPTQLEFLREILYNTRGGSDDDWDDESEAEDSDDGSAEAAGAAAEEEPEDMKPAKKTAKKTGGARKSRAKSKAEDTEQV